MRGELRVDRKSAIGPIASILSERFQANASFDPQGSRTQFDLTKRQLRRSMATFVEADNPRRTTKSQPRSGGVTF
jgi:hypothetical protein